jgi:hypothetical protein
MKEFLCYALFVLGIPILAGFLISAVVYIPVTQLIVRRCPSGVPSALHPYLEIFTGIGAAIASLLVFRFLALQPKIVCAVILAAHAFLYFAWAKGSHARWLSWLVGFVIGWFTLAKLLLP